MNTIELKNKLQEMMREAFINGTVKNSHPCYYIAIIETIIRYYLTVSGYYEEHAIKTFETFLKTGHLIFKEA